MGNLALFTSLVFAVLIGHIKCQDEHPRISRSIYPGFSPIPLIRPDLDPIRPRPGHPDLYRVTRSIVLPGPGPLRPTVPEPFNPFKPRPGQRKGPYPIYARTTRDIHSIDDENELLPELRQDGLTQESIREQNYRVARSIRPFHTVDRKVPELFDPFKTGQSRGFHPILARTSRDIHQIDDENKLHDGFEQEPIRGQNYRVKLLPQLESMRKTRSVVNEDDSYYPDYYDVIVKE